MPKIRVIIDTSTLRNDSRLSGGPMEALARYAEQGYVEIFIPHVVANEFTTLPSAKIESMAELRKTLKNLRQTAPSNLHKEISDFETRIGDAFDRMEAAAKQRFEQWVTRTGATIIGPGPDHAEKVLEKYFAGTPPFKSVKNRLDFPDAFIVEAILDAAAEGPVCVVTDDKGLALGLANASNITVFKTIKNLIDSETFEETVEGLETEYETENVKAVVAAFLQNKNLFTQTIEEDISILLSGKTVYYRNPHFDEKDGYDQLYIDTAESVDELKFDGDSDYLGEGVILINFDAQVAVSVDDSSGVEYYDESGERDTTRQVEVMGALSLQMDRDHLIAAPTPWTGTRLQESAKVSVDELLDVSLLNREY